MGAAARRHDALGCDGGISYEWARAASDRRGHQFTRSTDEPPGDRPLSYSLLGLFFEAPDEALANNNPAGRVARRESRQRYRHPEESHPQSRGAAFHQRRTRNRKVAVEAKLVDVMSVSGP